MENKNHICCDDNGAYQQVGEIVNKGRFIVGGYTLEVQNHFIKPSGAFSSVCYILHNKIVQDDLEFNKVVLFFRNHTAYHQKCRAQIDGKTLSIHFDIEVLSIIKDMLDSGEEIEVDTWNINDPNKETVGMLRYTRR